MTEKFETKEASLLRDIIRDMYEKYFPAAASGSQIKRKLKRSAERRREWLRGMYHAPKKGSAGKRKVLTARGDAFVSSLFGRIKSGSRIFSPFRLRLIAKHAGDSPPGAASERVLGEMISSLTALDMNNAAAPNYGSQFRILYSQRPADTVAFKYFLEHLKSLARGLHTNSYAYPVGGGHHRMAVHAAAQQVVDYLRMKSIAGVFKLDIRRCFDSLDHGLLRAAVETRMVQKNFTDERRMLVRSMLNDYFNGIKRTYASYLGGEYRESYPDRGILQGSAVSGLLANLYLDALDRFLHAYKINRKKVHFVRYADDVMVFLDEAVSSQHQKVWDDIRAFLDETLRLRMKHAACAYVDLNAGASITYLGLVFSRKDGTPSVRIAPGKIARIKREIKGTMNEYREHYHRIGIPLAQANIGWLIRRLNLKIGYTTQRSLAGSSRAPNAVKRRRLDKPRLRSKPAYYAKIPCNEAMKKDMEYLDRFLRDCVRVMMNGGKPLPDKVFRSGTERRKARKDLERLGLGSYLRCFEYFS